MLSSGFTCCLPAHTCALTHICSHVSTHVYLCVHTYKYVCGSHMHEHMCIYTQKYPYGYVYTCMHTHKYSSKSCSCTYDYIHIYKYACSYKFLLFPVPDLSWKQADIPGSSSYSIYVSYRILELWIPGTLEVVCLGSLLLYVLVWTSYYTALCPSFPICAMDIAQLTFGVSSGLVPGSWGYHTDSQVS